MGRRIFQAMIASARQVWNQSAEGSVVARKFIRSFITTTQNTLMFLGAATFFFIGVLLVKPGLVNQIMEMSFFTQKKATPQNIHISQLENWVETTPKSSSSSDEGEKVVPASHRQKQWVTNWISKRYRVASEATDMLVSAAYTTAREIKLDPLLILAVMAVESRFNPFAESPMGAQGLMQVMSKVHEEKFQELGGIEAALDPVANIKVGSMILKEYVTRGGSVEQGLKSYVGAGAMESDSGYGAKVLAEYQRLKDVARGKKVPTSSASNSTASKKRATQLAKVPDEDSADDDFLPQEARNDSGERKQVRL